MVVIPDFMPVKKFISDPTRLTPMKFTSPAIKILIMLALNMGVFLPPLNLFKRSHAFLGSIMSSERLVQQIIRILSFKTIFFLAKITLFIYLFVTLSIKYKII